MHIEVGNKFVVKEKLGSFCDVGEIAEVTEFTDDNMVGFAFVDDEKEGDTVLKRTGAMDVVTFERYFEEIEEEDIEEDEGIEAPSITKDDIYVILDSSKFDVYTVFDKCTVVSCQLPNGFVITESSACVDPENYNEELGFEICYDKIFDKVWELEAYRLQNDIYEWDEESVKCDCDDCDVCDCPAHPNYLS